MPVFRFKFWSGLMLAVFELCLVGNAFCGNPDGPARPPGVVIDYSPASSGIYIGSPSLAILPNGDYVASHDEFGPKSSEHTSAVTQVFTSHDRGLTWRRIS